MQRDIEIVLGSDLTRCGGHRKLLDWLSAVEAEEHTHCLLILLWWQVLLEDGLDAVEFGRRLLCREQPPAAGHSCHRSRATDSSECAHAQHLQSAGFGRCGRELQTLSVRNPGIPETSMGEEAFGQNMLNLM